MAGRVKLSMLIVGIHPVCSDLASFVKGQATLLGIPSRLVVDVCEHIQDTLPFRDFLDYDYVVLTVDPRHSKSLEKVKEEGGHLEKHLLSGRVCIVNLFCKAPSTSIHLEDLFDLSSELAVPVIAGDCSNKESTMYLAKRIACAASAALGVKNGVPYPL